MKNNYIFALAISILILLLLFVPLVAIAQTNVSNVRLHLSGPSVLGTLRSGTYSATFDDSESRDWSYKVYITASNTSGASPLLESPLNGTITPDNQTFTFDITAQQEVGELEIHVNCTSGTYFYEKVQTIAVVSPITLKCEVNNPTNVVIKNATVQFYVDDSEIDKQTIQSIGARQSTQVTSEWISNDKTSGWHETRILIDLNGDGVIDTNAGDMVIVDRFYIEGATDWMFALIVLIGLISLVIGFGYISKHKIK